MFNRKSYLTVLKKKKKSCWFIFGHIFRLVKRRWWMCIGHDLFNCSPWSDGTCLLANLSVVVYWILNGTLGHHLKPVILILKKTWLWLGTVLLFFVCMCVCESCFNVLNLKAVGILFVAVVIFHLVPVWHGSECCHVHGSVLTRTTRGKKNKQTNKKSL